MSDDSVKNATSRVAPIAAAMREALDDGAKLEAVIGGGLVAAFNEGSRAAASALLAQLIEQGVEVPPFEQPWPDSMDAFRAIVERHSD